MTRLATATATSVQVLFSARTPAGTTLYALDSASGAARPMPMPAGTAISTVRALGNGTALIATTNGEDVAELWFSDGNTVQRVLQDTRSTSEGWGQDMWRFTRLANGTTLFTADDGVSGLRLWCSDGTAAGTHVLTTEVAVAGNDSLHPWSITPVGENAGLFAADEDIGMSTLWVTDGTAAGTRWLYGSAPVDEPMNPGGFTPLDDGRVVFVATDPAHGMEVWITDGTAAGTQMVRDITPGQDDTYPQHLVALAGGKALFLSDSTLWCTDGTEAGDRKSVV